MATTQLDELLRQLPEIAKAVNAFDSETAQLRALDALLYAANGKVGVARHSQDDDGDAGAATHQEEKSNDSAVTSKPQTSRSNGKKGDHRRKRAETPSFVGDLNLRPKGKQSFREFYTEKSPKTNEQTFAVMIYYMKQALGVENVTADHIYTAFKDLGDTKVPLRLKTVISNSSTRHGWIDSSNSQDLRLTIHGENFVEHELPAKIVAAAK